jgi:putative hydrolase of HD superfamily
MTEQVQQAEEGIDAADRLDRQLRFLVEIDRLKTVVRNTKITDKSRYENSAEHSWHLAVCAMLLAEYADEPFDLCRVMRMVLIHASWLRGARVVALPIWWQ